MKKKVVAMFLAAVMAFSLMACGSKSDNGGSGDASGTETIKLGGVGPLTGGYANYGLSVQHGAELAAKEINAAGGVCRRYTKKRLRQWRSRFAVSGVSVSCGNPCQWRMCGSNQYQQYQHQSANNNGCHNNGAQHGQDDSMRSGAGAAESSTGAGGGHHGIHGFLRGLGHHGRLLSLRKCWAYCSKAKFQSQRCFHKKCHHIAQ